MITKVLNKTVLCPVIILGILLYFLSPKNISAEEIPQKFEIDINSDFSGSAQYVIELKNNYENKVIESYQMAMPLTKVTGIEAFLDNNPVNVSLVQNNVLIKFESKAIPPLKSASLNIKFIAKELVSYVSGMYFLRVNKAIQSESISYTINFPSSLKDYYYITASSPISENNQIKFSSEGGFFIAWGNPPLVNLSFYAKVVGDSNLRFFNLPSLKLNFDTVYKSVTGVDYGLEDKYKNLWGVIAPESPEFSFEAVIKPGNSVLSSNYPKYSNFIENFEQELNPEKLKEYSEKSNPEINEYLKSLQVNKNVYPAFSYCKALGAIAEIKKAVFVIEYGYLIFDELQDKDSKTLHVWCSVVENNKKILFDPYLEVISGYSFFDNNALDRVTLGIWDPESELISIDTLNNLTMQSYATINLEGESFFNTSLQNNGLTSSLEQIEIFDNYAVAKVVIPSVVKPVAISSFESNLKVSNVLAERFTESKVVALPFIENKIPIEILRNTVNPFSNTQLLDLNIKLEGNLNSEIYLSQNITWPVNKNFIFLTLWVVFLTTIYIAFTVRKNSKKFFYFIRKAFGFRI